MQEGLTAEHCVELLANALEQFLNGSRVSDESGRHFQSTRRNVTDCSFDAEVD